MTGWLPMCKILLWKKSVKTLTGFILREGIKKLDAVIYTHAHADHIDGIDDLKPLMQNSDEPIPIYLNKETYEAISNSFGYLFSGDGLIYKSVLAANIIENFSEFMIGDIKVQTFN